LVLFAIKVESGNAGTVRADMELEIQLKRVLVPGGIAGARGVAQDRASLPELLHDIKGCRMLESSQGIGK
jgi:hypothetical protein